MNFADEIVEPTINEQLSTDLNAVDDRPAPDLDREGIVSVNHHGRQGSNTAAKVGFVTICCALFIAVGLTLWNKHRLATSRDSEAAKVASHVENKPAAVGKPRQFAEVAPGSTADEAIASQGGVASVGTQAYAVPDTIEGPLDANTQPLGGGGRRQQGGTAGGAGSGGGPAVSDRYSGDIMVSSSSFGSAIAPAQSQAEAYAHVLSNVLDRNTGGTSATLTGPRETVEEKEPVRSEMDSRLATSPVEKVLATRLGDRSLTLPKGKTIDCTLTTRIMSELPGDVTCVLQSDVYSDNGRVVLLEKGSEATGEFGNTLVQGQHRLFVLWDRIKTPAGILISLKSPGTDALGTSGVPGYVDNRWFERIGSAFMLSFVKDAIAYKMAEHSGGGASGTYAFQDTMDTGNRMSEKVLDSTINLKPVMYANQGETLAIFVARDLDFESVYKLSLR